MIRAPGAPVTPPAARNDLVISARGLISETYRPDLANSGLTLASQVLRGTALGLEAGDVVTNILVCISTAQTGGSGIVNVGLYSAAYGKLQVSADVSASFSSTGFQALALTTPYPVTLAGLYYPVIDMTTAFVSSQPVLISSAAGNALASGAIGAKPMAFFSQSAQASLPATITPAATQQAIWFGVN